MARKPEYYRTPLRSRAAIISFLENHLSYRRFNSRGSCLAWNVKAYPVDLGFDHLVERMKESGEWSAAMNSTPHLQRCKELFLKNEQHLFEWGQEDAFRLVVDSDSYNHLWDGTPVDVKYESAGRSSGYLIMTSFEGHDLTSDPAFHEWDYNELRKLYSLVVMLDHDWTNKKAVEAIEFGAAWALFINVAGEPADMQCSGLELF